MNFIKGPVGQLEVAVHQPKQNVQAGMAVVCHPHSLYGGTMSNKVVTTLIKTFTSAGLLAARFNFRGVGKSEGQYDQGRGETEDVLAVVHWMQQHSPGQPLFLAGFSFGAFVAANAAQHLDLKQLILVAPPVNHFDFAHVAEFSCPWLVVQGEKDEVVPAEQVFAWVQSRQHSPLLIKMPETTHFFHGKLVELRERLSLCLNVLQ